jgi:hypothetical protein
MKLSNLHCWNHKLAKASEDKQKHFLPDEVRRRDRELTRAV